MSMHQATRVRFRGGDPLALTKRIQARRPARNQAYPVAPDERMTIWSLLGLTLFALGMWVVLGGFVWIVMAGAA